MGKGYRLLEDMERVMSSLVRYQVVEAVFQGASYRFEMRISLPHTLGDGEGGAIRQAAVKHESDSGDVTATPDAPGKRRSVLLRSPAAGIWRPASRDVPGKEGGNALSHAGTVHTVLSDEKVAAPRAGRVLMGIAEDSSLVGFGTPLALWETF